MSEKKFSVFVSSTYEDLKDERQAVIEALLESDCFPSVMEMFPASDEDQWEMIKSFIDASDYYLIVSAACYGSTDEDDISYTEKEYDYAVSIEKPIVTFIHNDISKIATKFAEKTDAGREHLIRFQKKLKSGKVVKFWLSRDELKTQIILSMNRIKRVRPTPGWLRADMLPTSQMLAELHEKNAKIDELESSLLVFTQRAKSIKSDYAWYEDEFTLCGSIERDGKKIGSWDYTAPWLDLYGHYYAHLRPNDSLNVDTLSGLVCTHIISAKDNYPGERFGFTSDDGEREIKSLLNFDDDVFYIYSNTNEVVLSQLTVHGLITRTKDVVGLTPFGIQHFVESAAIKKPNPI